MNLQQGNFLNITAAYVAEKKAEVNNPDWNEIYKLSQIHSLSGMVYAVINNNNLCADSEVMNKITGAFMRTVGISVNQEIVLNNLIDLFNLHKIKHIVFKGTVLRDYYPDKELRTMGDIDLIIDESDRQKVHKLLLETGALYEEAESHADVFNYMKNGVLFEIHTKIISSNLFEETDYINYLGDVFKHTEQKENYTYELNNEFHFIYLMAHMAKHFKIGGCGLRMYIDIAMFVKHFNRELDWKYIRAELKKLRLLEFTDSVFQFCNKWFGTDIALFGKELDSEALDIIAKYVIAGGTFGYYEKNVDAIRMGNNDNTLTSKIKTVGGFLFPSYEHLKMRYKWMGNLPKCMLPFAWVKYWHYRLFIVKGNNFKRIKQAVESGDDAFVHYRLMKTIGLDD
ncbi:MAG: nucleotidyltransferase family protein [Clostridiales bacterium]|nr:nucleotidyltransferase family protein [Clostridiales bacterium]